MHRRLSISGASVQELEKELRRKLLDMCRYRQQLKNLQGDLYDLVSLPSLPFPLKIHKLYLELTIHFVDTTSKKFHSSQSSDSAPPTPFPSR